MSDELKEFGRGRCHPFCSVCGRTESCRCAVFKSSAPVVTPVVNGLEGFLQEYPSRPDEVFPTKWAIRIDSELKPPIPMLREISLEVAVEALLLAAHGASIGFWVNDQQHARRVMIDFIGLIATGAFTNGCASLSVDEVSLTTREGRIAMITDQRVSQGHFRGVTFAQVWDVR